MPGSEAGGGTDVRHPAHIRLAGIVKSYGGKRALDDVALEITAGTVHALVGANGAGKSTLGKIIAGAIRPDAGEMYLDGQPVRWADPHDARRHGIALIAQELALVPHLSVMQNVFLGIEPRRIGLVARQRLARQYGELVERWGFKLDRDAPVGQLRLADQQMVEILRAVATGARAIVMDEPTSSLTHVEIETLRTMVHDLRRGGTTIVYVSHFLDDVVELADTISVLRDGRLVHTVPAAEETEASLVRAMFGATVEAQRAETPVRAPGAVVLEVRGLRRGRVLRDVSLSIREGEIVGLAGLVGSGRSELARAIFGADHAEAGTISVDGVERRVQSPRDAIRAGIAFVPESRKHDGLFMELSLGPNTTIAHVRSIASKIGVVKRGAERAHARRLITEHSIAAPSPAAKLSTLSGGNQQKVLFAKWLFRRPRVLLLDEPTRGVDVNARAAIHRLINDLAGEGVAILLISSEIEEVLALAHRVLVIAAGAITHEFAADPPLADVMEAAFGVDAPEAIGA
ncbi:MAG TPA: sugar ABC transporter ATP-binding protein [Solirubrobacteraceae bacterium]|nr:sugar ABC transporter ATP-binding protein [Solirubrobacteraceae bacterium]